MPRFAQSTLTFLIGVANCAIPCLSPAAGVNANQSRIRSSAAYAHQEELPYYWLDPDAPNLGKVAESISHSLIKHDRAAALDNWCQLEIPPAPVPRGRQADENGPEPAAGAAPESAAELYNLAITLDKQGDKAEAEAKLREATRIDPQYAQAFFMLGELLRARQEYAQAEIAYRSYIRLKPDDYLGRNNLAWACVGRGRYADAEAAWRVGVALAPNNPMELANLGYALSKQGRFAEAESFYREAFRIMPNYKFESARLEFINTLTALGKDADAEAEYRTAIQLNPKEPRFRVDFASFLVQQRKYDGAASLFGQVLTANDKDPEALRGLAKIEKVEPDPRLIELALKAARRAVELTMEQDGSCLDALAAAQFRAGDTAGAAATQEKAIRTLKEKFKDRSDADLKPYNDRLERYRNKAAEKQRPPPARHGVYLVGAQLYKTDSMGQNSSDPYQFSTNTATDHYYFPINGGDGQSISYLLSQGSNSFSFTTVGGAVRAGQHFGLNLFFNTTGAPYDPAPGSVLPADLTVYTLAEGSSVSKVTKAGMTTLSYGSSGSTATNALANGTASILINNYRVSISSFNVNLIPAGGFAVQVTAAPEHGDGGRDQK